MLRILSEILNSEGNVNSLAKTFGKFLFENISPTMVRYTYASKCG